MFNVWCRIAGRHIVFIVTVLSVSTATPEDVELISTAVSLAQVRVQKSVDGVAMEIESPQADSPPSVESMEAKEDEDQELEFVMPPNQTMNAGLLMARLIHKGMPKHRIDHLNPVGQDVEYHGLYEGAITFPIRCPWATNLLIATSKTFFADLIVQASSPRDASGARLFDWRRSLLFTTFGFLYVGMAQWFFYVSMFSRLCPDAMTFASESLAVKMTDTVGQEDLAIQVIVDQFIISPFIYFPIFYILKEFLKRCLQNVEPDKMEKKDSTALVVRAMSNYAGNFKEDNLTSLSIWLPADIIIFMVPMVMRMPLDHAVAFVWTMFLSYMRGGTK